MQVGGDGVDIVALILLAYLVSLAAGLFAAGVAMRRGRCRPARRCRCRCSSILFLAPVYVPLDLLAGWLHGSRPRTRSRR